MTLEEALAELEQVKAQRDGLISLLNSTHEMYREKREFAHKVWEERGGDEDSNPIFRDTL